MKKRAKNAKKSQAALELQNKFVCAACGQSTLRGVLVAFECLNLSGMVVKTCRSCAYKVEKFDLKNANWLEPAIVSEIRLNYKPSED